MFCIDNAKVHVLCQEILIFNIFLFKRCFDPLGFGGCSLSDQFKSLVPGV